ncbi:hypothetical protein Q6294_12860 [Klebsiella pneumoniae]|uniref:Uncharacterized protein n=1 Tax=Klebsiella pneumoniae TaxID=573 RepID=A0AAW8AEJ3_KLEPN|nr:hypothetical protein [Klebsiella pneumoniae]MDP0967922.1 hypothetical protein [Klebsiella pneumoniae]MEA4708468.1 hypothetical protein [Klebsiella pneumoniae]
MKTQMQIVQEAIALLEAMSREEFRATLVAAGAYEPELMFSKEISGFEPAEKSPVEEGSFSISRSGTKLHSELSLVFQG